MGSCYGAIQSHSIVVFTYVVDCTLTMNFADHIRWLKFKGYFNMISNYKDTLNIWFNFIRSQSINSLMIFSTTANSVRYTIYDFIQKPTYLWLIQRYKMRQLLVAQICFKAIEIEVLIVHDPHTANARTHTHRERNVHVIMHVCKRKLPFRIVEKRRSPAEKSGYLIYNQSRLSSIYIFNSIPSIFALAISCMTTMTTIIINLHKQKKKKKIASSRFEGWQKVLLVWIVKIQIIFVQRRANT